MRKCKKWKTCANSCWDANNDIPVGSSPLVCLCCVNGSHFAEKKQKVDMLSMVKVTTLKIKIIKKK